jgi:FtsP/CotA-like multicopper oxidase with cupredoxin domain
MTKINPIIILGALVLITLIAGGLLLPSILGAIADFIKDLGEQYRAWVPNAGNAGNNTDYALLSLTITYADGQTREFKPDAFSILPFTIVDPEGEVISLTFTAKAKVTYSGTLASWGVQANLYGLLRNPQGGKIGRDYLFSKTMNPTGTSWPSGEEKQIVTETVQASAIETMLKDNDAPSGEYYLDAGLAMTLNINFHDQTSDQALGTTKIRWDFQYDQTLSEIESLQVTITYSHS